MGIDGAENNEKSVSSSYCGLFWVFRSLARQNFVFDILGNQIIFLALYHSSAKSTT
jgi:hypothetical protein